MLNYFPTNRDLVVINDKPTSKQRLFSAEHELFPPRPKNMTEDSEEENENEI